MAAKVLELQGYAIVLDKVVFVTRVFEAQVTAQAKDWESYVMLDGPGKSSHDSSRDSGGCRLVGVAATSSPQRPRAERRSEARDVLR